MKQKGNIPNLVQRSQAVETPHGMLCHSKLLIAYAAFNRFSTRTIVVASDFHGHALIFAGIADRVAFLSAVSAHQHRQQLLCRSPILMRRGACHVTRLTSFSGKLAAGHIFSQMTFASLSASSVPTRMILRASFQPRFSDHLTANLIHSRIWVAFLRLKRN